MNTYKDMERNWHTTKPIRGRSVDVRPIGQRRRDWEQIVRHPIDEGMWSYAARLYGTDVVTYLPNGDIILNANGWHTPSTAEFINQHSPFMCIKRHNKLWVHARASMEHPSSSIKAYPLSDGPMRFNHKGANFYEPSEKVVIKKKVIDKVLAKEAREPLQPFLAWAKAFITMSEGWVMHETRKEVLGFEKYDGGGAMRMPRHIRNEREMYDMLTVQADFEPEAVYLRVLCSLASNMYEEQRVAETHAYEGTWGGRATTHTQNFYDYRVPFDAVKRKVYGWVERYENVHRIVESEPGNNSMRNVV